ncbi:MAG: acyltransferase [Planctomycetales bacterium]
MASRPVPSRRPVWLDVGRIPSLDGMRAIAILMVLLTHACQTRRFPVTSEAEPWVKEFLITFASFGVEVFFVLSGFLITVLMMREIDRTDKLDLGAFYRRRAYRILPAYVALLIVVAVLQLCDLTSLRAIDWLAALTYTINFLERPAWEIGHAWSLSIEEHFYLLWPMVVVLVPAKRRVPALLLCLANCFLLRWYVLLFHPEWTSMAELWTFTRLDSIATGCLLAVLAQETGWRNFLDRLSRYWPVALGLLTASLFFGHISTKLAVGCGYTLNAACLGLLLWTAVQKNPNWLNTNILGSIGLGSYSLYLWQQLFLNPYSKSWWTAFPENICLTMVVAWLSYRLIETPFLKLKDRAKRAGA